jgi:hypothetical protein
MPRPGIEPGPEVPESNSPAVTQGRSEPTRATILGFSRCAAIDSDHDRLSSADGPGKVSDKVSGAAQRFTNPAQRLKSFSALKFIAHFASTLPRLIDARS